MGVISTEIKRQKDEIRANHQLVCDTVILGTNQLRQLFQESAFITSLKTDMPTRVHDLEIRSHPSFNGVLVLPKKKEESDMRLKPTKRLKLTEEEKQIILNGRAKAKLRRRVQEQALRLLKTAYDYAMWLEKYGVTDSESAFYIKFGYSQNPDCQLDSGGNWWPRDKTWRWVHRIWEIAGIQKYQAVA